MEINMKKYIYLFSIINSFSLLCMEQQRPQLFDADYNKTANSSLVSYQDTYSHHGVYPPLFSVKIEANQPGWEKLNAIGNMTYNTPIYRPVGTLRYATAQQQLQQTEKKILLQTNIPTQPDLNALKEELYDKVDYFIDMAERNHSKKELCILRDAMYKKPFQGFYSSALGQYLTHIIRSMKYAKEYNVTEDMMGHYSYDKDSSRMLKPSRSRALIFSVLKKYFYAASITSEQLPFGETSTVIINPICFLQALNNQHDIKNNIGCLNNSYSVLYPVFSDLVHNLYYLLREEEINAIENGLASFFYATQNVVSQNSAIKNSPELSEFYKKAYKMVLYFPSYQQIYDLLCMIEFTRKSTTVAHEDKLAEQMRTFNPTMMEKWFGSSDFLRDDAFTEDIRNHISRLFTTIKKYNQARLYRITPTPEQFKAYCTIQRLAIPLPDSWSSNIFDTEQYAFIEFTYLVGALNELRISLKDAKEKK